MHMKQINIYIFEKLKLNKDSEANNENIIEEITNIISNYLALKYKWKQGKEFNIATDNDKRNNKYRIMLYSGEFNQFYNIETVSKDLKNKLSKYIESVDTYVTAIYFNIKKELI